MHASKFVILKPKGASQALLKGSGEHKESKAVAPKGKKAQVLRRGGKKAPSIDLPPTIKVTPMARAHTFRFQCGTGGATSVTAADVIGALGTVCTVTNTTVRPFCSSFRIRKVTVWSDVSASSEQNVSVSWALATGAQIKDDEENRSLPTGVSVTGGVVSRPPRGTLASLWQAATANTIFIVSANAGSILDMLVEFTLSNQIVSGTQNITTGVLGTIYYLSLDGSTGRWPAIGLPTTV